MSPYITSLLLAVISPFTASVIAASDAKAAAMPVDGVTTNATAPSVDATARTAILQAQAAPFAGIPPGHVRDPRFGSPQGYCPRTRNKLASPLGDVAVRGPCARPWIDAATSCMPQHGASRWLEPACIDHADVYWTETPIPTELATAVNGISMISASTRPTTARRTVTGVQRNAYQVDDAEEPTEPVNKKRAGGRGNGTLDSANGAERSTNRTIANGPDGEADGSASTEEGQDLSPQDDAQDSQDQPRQGGSANGQDPNPQAGAADGQDPNPQDGATDGQDSNPEEGSTGGQDPSPQAGAANRHPQPPQDGSTDGQDPSPQDGSTDGQAPNPQDGSTNGQPQIPQDGSTNGQDANPQDGLPTLFPADNTPCPKQPCKKKKTTTTKPCKKGPCKKTTTKRCPKNSTKPCKNGKGNSTVVIRVRSADLRQILRSKIVKHPVNRGTRSGRPGRNRHCGKGMTKGCKRRTTKH